MLTSKEYDSIVVGAGHAGIEAALAIARAGYQVLFLTTTIDTIGKMSCNPAIGGLAKGHMVREIDALGGQMALTTDQTSLQLRMLNKSKGPAVWAPRAQSDKKKYSAMMTKVIEQEKNIHLKQHLVEKILVKNGRAIGVVTQTQETFYGRSVVVSSGTFMKGLIHIGDVNFPGGRGGEPPCEHLSDSLRELGLELKRFKTGTPPRLHAKSINYDILELAPGDEDPEPFSFRTKQLINPKIPCWLTYTNQNTHEIIRKNLHLSPLYAGRIEGIGPRYCPSIEDKVVKFADKERHQIYLEPEGLDTEEIYVNGLSMSLPQHVQEQIVKTLPGCENAEIVRLAYAIEYDYAPPTQLKLSLETKVCENLFLAGQINGTSGYEEAAAQGLMAGLNVIRKLRGESPFILSRSEAYIGVLIDDLVTLGTNEPYRMFTSRAEFRLLLRQDNADERLMKYGHSFGLISEETYQQSLNKQQKIKTLIGQLRAARHENASLEKMLRRPEITLKTLPGLANDFFDEHPDILRQVELNVKYEGYINRQLQDVLKFQKLEARRIPATFEFTTVKGLSREALEKFNKVRPSSVGQAARIPGITSGDLSILLVSLLKSST
ncbi:MAG: tRNA uridine-5-carboxymethylaminomethyl(34) synthesis enzyme MnmG [Candidatus Omnitrophica bacterium]|nr:tRNA uridine-5-carboxymethylaminomethyl(34) synthesis enzyme MnmG [Candidatus Omnitrophota bacterium]